MKRKKIIIPLIIILPILLLIGKCYYHDSTFVEKNMREYTGVKKYIITVSYYDNHNSFIEVILTSREKQLLLKRMKFKEDMEDFRGKIKPDFFSEKEGFVYHVIKRGERSYRYILIALEKNGNIMQVYELYGDH